jgi:porin
MTAIMRCRIDRRRSVDPVHGKGSRGHVLRLLALGVLIWGVVICISQPGKAQQQSAPTIAVDSPTATPPTASFGQSLESWMNQATMTGDWGGLRTRLSQDGFNFRASYIGEYAYSFSGGKRIGGDYAQQLAVGMDLDMDKVAGLTGGTFHVSLNVREGRSTTADDIGNKIAVQEIYGDGNNTRLAEVSYQQLLFNNILDLKAGFIVMGDDFARTGILCDFENDAFCAHPNSLPSNSGWSDYPAGKWGGRVRVNLPDDFYAETGVIDVNPTYAAFNNGFKLSLQGSTGALVPVEFGKTVKLGSAALPGHYKIGGYYDTSDAPDVTNPHLSYSGRYGGYILADQMILSFEPGTDRGLIAVASVTLSDKRTSPLPTYFTLALVAQGPLAVRPHDFIAIGYVRDPVNSRVINQENAIFVARGLLNPELEQGENIVELAYGLQVAPWMNIHPNVQYIGNPGAFSFKHVPDAWVFGTHLGLTF